MAAKRKVAYREGRRCERSFAVTFDWRRYAARVRSVPAAPAEMRAARVIQIRRFK